MVTVKHTFVSAIADDPTSVARGDVVPSKWNATHAFTGGANNVVALDGTGNATELTKFQIRAVAVNVADFGATGNGSTDDTAAIQAAINSLPVTGGTVFFPSGNYLISSTLTIGNGTNTTQSSVSGVRLVGFGLSFFNSVLGFVGEPAATRITASAAFNNTTPMILFQGPLQGWSVENFIIDGGTQNAIGLEVISAAFGNGFNLCFLNCFGSILSTTLTNPAVQFRSAGGDSLSNTYRNILIAIPAGANAYGIKFTGNNIVNADTDYNLVDGIFITWPTGNTNTPIGLWLQVCDTCTFRNIHFSGSGTTGATGVAFDYTVNSAFPAGNTFFGIDGGTPGTSYANIGAAGPTGPNIVYGITEANNAKQPNLSGTLVGGSLFYGNVLSTNVGSGSTGNSLVTLWNGGLFVIRLSYYVVVTATGGAGTAKLTFKWNDASAAQSFNTATVDLTSLGSFTSGQLVVYTGDGTTRPTVDIVFAGASGSPKITIAIVPERIMEF